MTRQQLHRARTLGSPTLNIAKVCFSTREGGREGGRRKYFIRRHTMPSRIEQVTPKMREVGRKFSFGVMQLSTRGAYLNMSINMLVHLHDYLFQEIDQLAMMCFHVMFSCFHVFMF